MLMDKTNFNPKCRIYDKNDTIKQEITNNLDKYIDASDQVESEVLEN